MPSQIMPTVNLMKLPDPAAQTAKYVNMMNATKQLEAAERQAATAEKRNQREEDLQVPALATAKTGAEVAQLEYTMKFYNETANDLANASTPDQAIARGERLKKLFPEPALQQRIDETINDLVSDPSRFEENRKRILIRTLGAKEQFAETHSDIFDAEGNLYNKKTSPIGAFPTEITPGVVTGPPVTRAAPTAPPRTPVVPTAAPATPPQMPAGDGGQLDAFQQDHVRRMKEGLGMTDTPASFTRGGMATPTAGQMSPDMVPAILDSAINTGVMAQIDLDQMLAMTPPQARQGIMDVIRSSNIALQADAPSLAASAMNQQQPMAVNPVQRPDSIYANLPPRELQDSQPMMQNTLAQYQVGQQIKGRNPSMSPYPGSAQVPLSRVAAEAAVQRETPEQAAARAAATARATATVETEKKAAEKLPGRNQVSSLVKKIRNAYETLEKQEAIVSEKRGGIANAMDYFGTTSLGREAQKMVGTRSSKYLSEIVNSRKLLATAIKNATGMSAQEMNSNTELQLMLDALTDPTQGIEAARSTLGTIEELYGAPRTAAPAAAASRAAAKTPVIPDAAKQMLRKNPSPQQRAFFDRTFGKGAAAKVMGNR